MNRAEFMAGLKRQAKESKERFRDIKHTEREIEQDISDRKERRKEKEDRRKRSAKEFYSAGRNLDSAFGVMKKKKRNPVEVFTGRGLF